jgi:hypothetical protein
LSWSGIRHAAIMTAIRHSASAQFRPDSGGKVFLSPGTPAGRTSQF